MALGPDRPGIQCFRSAAGLGRPSKPVGGLNERRAVRYADARLHFSTRTAQAPGEKKGTALAPDLEEVARVALIPWAKCSYARHGLKAWLESAHSERVRHQQRGEILVVFPVLHNRHIRANAYYQGGD